VFRRKLAKTADYTPAYSEQKELLRRAEAHLRDAETRAALVKKWTSVLPQAVLEYHASARRITDLSRGEIPRAVGKLTRMVEALEAYLREAPPTGGAVPPPAGTRSPLEAVADAILADDESTAEPAADRGDGPAASPTDAESSRPMD
jgi:hypothetical protein